MNDDNISTVIHTRVPRRLEHQLRHLVDEGYYSNISDALRDAARRLVDEHGIKHVERPKFELRTVELGKKAT
ncbi:MAG: ribbon-helix-helix domain-containing protein [archaeon]